MSTNDPNYAKNVEAFSKLVKAMGDYTLEVDQGQLALAQSQVAEAEADRERLGNEEYRLRIKRLAMQEHSLATDQRKADDNLKAVQQHIHRVSQLEVEGRTNQFIFYSLNQLFITLNDPQLVAKVMGTKVPAEANSKSNFEYNDEARSKEAPIPDFGGGSIGMLVQFMKPIQLQFVPWMPAHMAMLAALTDLSSAADDKANTIEARIDALRDKNIPGLPPPAGGADPGTGSSTPPKPSPPNPSPPKPPSNSSEGQST